MKCIVQYPVDSDSFIQEDLTGSSRISRDPWQRVWKHMMMTHNDDDNNDDDDGDNDDDDDDNNIVDLGTKHNTVGTHDNDTR